jgi:hypothetical protein
MTPDLTALSNGMMVIFKPFGANAGATTLNIDNLGAKSIVKGGAAALVENDLVTTQPAFCIYDLANTRFLLLNPQTAAITPATILTALLTVDGAGSGLDADLLDGISSAGFAQTSSGSYTGTLSGVSGAVTTTVRHATAGNVVLVSIDNITGTSDAATFSITGTGVPNPARQQAIPIYSAYDNGSLTYQAAVLVETSGTLTFVLNNNNSGWTASGTKGFNRNIAFAYHLT